MRPAIIVGGTGLYFKALTRGLAAVPPIPAEIRETVRARLASEGVAALHAELILRDPAAAARLRRTTAPASRARSKSSWRPAARCSIGTTTNKPAILDLAGAAKVFLMPERDELLRRIDARFDAMMAAGALDEVRALAARKLNPEPAGHEGAWRAVADPPPQRRDRA